MKVWDSHEPLTFLEALQADGDVVNHLGDSLAELFEYADYTRHADLIFRRVFGE